MEASNNNSYGVLESVMKDVVKQNDTRLIAEWRKHQLIVLIYRLVAILVGVLCLFLGYFLFSSSVIDGENIKNYYFSLERILPGVILAACGVVFILIGIVKLMPLPQFEKPGGTADTTKQKMQLPEDGIPVLTNGDANDRNDKVWQKNVKPLILKIANNEEITPVDRDLLKKWLRNTK